MALSSEDKKEVEKIVKKEVKDFLDTTKAHDIVVKIIQKELGTKKIDDKIVDLATKVVIELYKVLWTRNNFWVSALKNVRS
jgi:GTP-binding protein EngB required for normal cell division